MAEAIAGPFVSFVVKRLGEVLIQEANFLRGVSGQVQEMQRELNRTQCFLKDAAAKREAGDERVRNWVAEIREAAYDAEAVIDTFIIKVGFRRETGSILNVLMRYSCVFKFKDCIGIHKVGVKIESIKTKIASIRTSLESYGVRAIPEGESSSSSRYERQRLPRQSYDHIMEDDDIVGLDEDMKTIVELLVKEDRQCRVVSIVGMGGLGKTTLAKKVYDHNDVRRHFDCFAWVFVSQQNSTIEVLVDILFQLSPVKRERIQIMKHAQLIEKLRKVHSQKKCLIVLDDIWRAEDWNSLSPVFFNENATGSKFLLTTRMMKVASLADRPYELKFLTQSESWELFKRKAFLRRNVTEIGLSTEMMELSKEVVKYSGGLPYAIVMFGGLATTKHNLYEWEMMFRKISYLSTSKNDTSFADILELCYEDLPYHLKACLLHFSQVPKDYNIPSETLVQMWIAEGIVSSSSISAQVRDVKGEETLLDVGLSYLGELVTRCMIQVQLTRFSRRIKLCGLHDLMRYFCSVKSKKENFFKVICMDTFHHKLIWENLYSSSTETKIRRLLVYYFSTSGGSGDEITNMNNNQVWSCQFYSFNNEMESSDWEQIKSLLESFKLLRVLDLEGVYLSSDKMMLPRAIGNLLRLRYLSTRSSNIGGLPSSIGNLGFLQTLNLRTYPGVEIKIPNVLWKLKQLRHLYLPFEIELPSTGKLRLDGLSNLETLEDFDTEYCDVRCFSTLTNLRNVIVGWIAINELVAIVKSPMFHNTDPHTRYLSFFIRGDFQTKGEQNLLWQLLGCRHLHKLSLSGSLNSIKLPDQFPLNLTKLTLKRSKLEEDPMPTLEKIPNLRTLFLLQNSYIGKEMVCSAAPTTQTATTSSSSGGGFPQLKYLHIEGIENLEDWRVEEGAMKSLSQLEIYKCGNLKEIPDGLRVITTLRELKIENVSEALKDRVREGGEDFWKVKHVFSITIFD